MTLNRMYHWVPRMISGESQMFGFSRQATIAITANGKQHVGREGGQELGDRLDALGPGRAQADPHADRHPDQAGDGDQHQHAQQGDQAQAEGASDVAPASRRGVT